MSKSFRIVDLRDNSAGTECGIVEGVPSPEVAVQKALGLDVVRSGARSQLVAKVYYKNQDDMLNMVRMYRRLEDDGGRRPRSRVSRSG